MVKLFKESLSDNAPTEKDKIMAKFIISDLPNAGNDKIPAMKVMLDYAYRWKDIKMWQDLTKRCGEDIKVQGESGLVQAWHVFGFDQTRARYIYLFDFRFLLTILLVLRSCCAINACHPGSRL